MGERGLDTRSGGNRTLTGPAGRLSRSSLDDIDGFLAVLATAKSCLPRVAEILYSLTQEEN